MKRICFLIYFLISINLYSQVEDNFDDGNFTLDPPWTGNATLFRINDNNQLQLNDIDEGMASLSTSSNSIVNTEWRFWIKMSFSPSSNNYSRYYLAGNSSNLCNEPDGFFLQFGESGSDDGIELFKQKGSELVSILRSEDGIISSSFEISVKVTRDESGTWKLYLDKTGGVNFLFETEGYDDEFTSAQYLGVYCKYTKSNSSKMYFDDIYCGNWIVDNEPPLIEDVLVDTDTTILLVFSEFVDTTCLVTNNFMVNNSIGNPVNVSIVESDYSRVVLTFSNKFDGGIEHELEITNITDLSGNIMSNTTIPFLFYNPQPNDIVINEIMVDPSPVVGLPEYEYIELFNTTSIEIDLSNWTLEIGSSLKDIENLKISPQGYIILTKDEAIWQFEGFGEAYGFNSFSLTNGGQNIALKDEKEIIISEVEYNDSWYNDDEKSNGGWSLEQINYENICSKAENWSSSIDMAGGTPGKRNSISSDQILPPEINKLVLVSSNTIELLFNQQMNETSITNPENYKLSGNNIDLENIYSNVDDRVIIVFKDVFKTGVVYELSINTQIDNCIGIKTEEEETILFGIPEIPEKNDIVINEVLFDPWTNGDEYIEIYNRSEKIFDLKEIKMGYVHQTIPNPPDTNEWQITSEQKLLMPNGFCLMTPSPSLVVEQYFTNNESNFTKIENLPGLNNNEGLIYISTNHILIDTFSYSEDLHFPLLNYTDGVSLERINPDMMLHENNWHSASESSGFGTPGCANSQTNNFELEMDEIEVFPEVFSPNNDGIDDVQHLTIGTNTSGNTINVQIYNSNGYLIRNLVNNEYTGSFVSISWDGLTESNSQAPSGIYIYFISMYNIDGNKRCYKKAGVLAQ